MRAQDGCGPRVADLSALLADLDALRTTLSTDLSLVAAAVEVGAGDLVGELVSGDLEALRHVEARWTAQMAAAPLVAAAAAVVGLPVGLPTGAPAPGPSAAIRDPGRRWTPGGTAPRASRRRR